MLPRTDPLIFLPPSHSLTPPSDTLALSSPILHTLSLSLSHIHPSHIPSLPFSPILLPLSISLFLSLSSISGFVNVYSRSMSLSIPLNLSLPRILSLISISLPKLYLSLAFYLYIYVHNFIICYFHLPLRSYPLSHSLYLSLPLTVT